ncbi:MAG: TonB-dependent receptor plug domain-containing protein, partial [Flavobacteriales bacterium]|nr:TonB-dependent receptor plug domain-containing protein [Flavobacteriales bacterium]
TYKILPDDLRYSKVIRMFPEVINVSAAEKVYISGRDVNREEVPQQVEVIGVSEIKFKNPQTTAHLLESSGQVLIQRSQMGGGSPILRGFEANKVLLVVDGVRLNNAIYRSGHLQNAITVDSHVLRQTEVVFGPSSVVYGSDALGGVIHFRTKVPKLGETPGEQHVSGHVMSRLSSSNQEKTHHVDVEVGAYKFGSLTSITTSDFGNLRMGTQRDHGDADWGLVNYYAGFEEGIDVNLKNPDPTVQRGTAYSQLDFLQKFLFQPNDDLNLTANFQYSTSSAVPRFDRLNDLQDGKVRWAEWHYGPQKRLLFSLRAELSDSTSLYDDVRITAAAQRIEEDRIQRRFGQSTRSTQMEDVWVYSINSD